MLNFLWVINNIEGDILQFDDFCEFIRVVRRCLSTLSTGKVARHLEISPQCIEARSSALVTDWKASR
ncbi:unnamed protein product [Calypogeia fissa]